MHCQTILNLFLHIQIEHFNDFLMYSPYQSRCTDKVIHSDFGIYSKYRERLSMHVYFWTVNTILLIKAIKWGCHLQQQVIKRRQLGDTWCTVCNIYAGSTGPVIGIHLELCSLCDLFLNPNTYFVQEQYVVWSQNRWNVVHPYM